MRFEDLAPVRDHDGSGPVTIDDAFRAYAAERLTGIVWFPPGESFASGRTIIRVRDRRIEVVDSDERGVELPGSSVVFAEEAFALLSAIARRRVADGGATFAQTERMLEASAARSISPSEARELLEHPVLVPSTESGSFEAAVSDGVGIAATGWQGLEAAGYATAVRTVLPLGALLLVPTASLVVVHTRQGRAELGRELVVALRTQMATQGGLFSTGAAYVGDDGSVKDRVAAIRDIPDGVGVDWFPPPSAERSADRVGIVWRGDAWTVWSPARIGSIGASESYSTEHDALTGLIRLLKANEVGEG